MFSTLGDAEVADILLRKDAINFGQAYENAVAQELRAHGRGNLYYYNSTKVGEAGFLLEGRGTTEVIPLEVKSGKYSRRHAALDRLLEARNCGIERAVVLHDGNVSVEGKVTYLPLYMAALL